MELAEIKKRSRNTFMNLLRVEACLSGARIIMLHKKELMAIRLMYTGSESPLVMAFPTNNKVISNAKIITLWLMRETIFLMLESIPISNYFIGGYRR